MLVVGLDTAAPLRGETGRLAGRERVGWVISVASPPPPVEGSLPSSMWSQEKEMIFSFMLSWTALLSLGPYAGGGSGGGSELVSD
jgi:hypothetical protein